MAKEQRFQFRTWDQNLCRKFCEHSSCHSLFYLYPAGLNSWKAGKVEASAETHLISFHTGHSLGERREIVHCVVLMSTCVPATHGLYDGLVEGCSGNKMHTSKILQPSFPLDQLWCKPSLFCEAPSECTMGHAVL